MPAKELVDFLTSRNIEILKSRSQLKEAGRTIGHTTRDVARDIGHGTCDAAKSVGEGVKKVVKSASEDE